MVALETLPAHVGNPRNESLADLPHLGGLAKLSPSGVWASWRKKRLTPPGKGRLFALGAAACHRCGGAALLPSGGGTMRCGLCAPADYPPSADGCRAMAGDRKGVLAAEDAARRACERIAGGPAGAIVVWRFLRAGESASPFAWPADIISTLTMAASDVARTTYSWEVSPYDDHGPLVGRAVRDAARAAMWDGCLSPNGNPFAPVAEVWDLGYIPMLFSSGVAVLGVMAVRER